MDKKHRKNPDNELYQKRVQYQGSEEFIFREEKKSGLLPRSHKEPRAERPDERLEERSPAGRGASGAALTDH